MRVATFLTAAAIAALTTVGPALAYGPAASNLSLSNSSGGPETVSSAVAKEQIKVAFAIVKKRARGGYLYVRGDNGQRYPNCGAKANCTLDSIDVFESNHPESGTITIDCSGARGCVKVGKTD